MAVNRAIGQWKPQKVEAMAVAAAGVVAVMTNTASGIPIRLEVWGGATYAGRVVRRLAATDPWIPVTAAGMAFAYSGPVSEEVGEDAQAGAQYGFEVTSYTGGALNVRLSQ